MENMNIKKIEIKNLASFEGEHIIDFSVEPLKSTGLFAIIGKSVTGKKDILDAICIALYGKPFHLKQTEDTNEQNNNYANLLYRGCQDGYCKVTFSLDNGSTYEAEWSIHFNRSKNVNDIKHSLKQIAPKNDSKAHRQNIPNKVTELVGLNYNQFVSTVILAQKDFFNFLNAKQIDKAQLLEKLTGTEIYSRMSQMVSQKTFEADKAYENMLSQLNGIKENCLSEDLLKKHTESLLLDRSRFSKDEEEITEVQKHLEWYSLYRQAKENLEKQTSSQMQIQREYNAMYDQKSLLERYEKVLPFQHLYNKIVEKKERIEKLRQNISNCQIELRKLNANLETSQNSYEKSRDRLHTTEIDYQDKLPLINHAHVLQGEIQTDLSLQASLEKDAKELKEQLCTLQNSLSAKTLQFEKKSKEQQEHTYELQTIAMHRAMAEKTDEIKGQLQKIHELYLDSNDCTNKLENIAKDVKKDKAKNDDLIEKKNVLLAQTQSFQGDLVIHIQANQGLNSADIQNRIIHLSDLQRDALNARDLWINIANNYEEQDNLSNELRSLSAELKKLETEIPLFRLLLDEKKKHFETANKNLLLTQNKEIIDMRKQLKQGSPCPVCGGTHHPYYGQLLGDLLSNLSQDFEETKIDFNNTQKQLDEMIIDKSQKEILSHEKQNNLEKLKQQIKERISQWERYVYLDKSFHDTSSSVNRTNRTILLAHMLDSSTRELEQEKKLNEEYNRHQKAINDINANIQKLNDDIDEVNRDLTDLKARNSVHESLTQELNTRKKNNEDKAAVLISQLESSISIPLWKEKNKTEYEVLIQEITDISSKWNLHCIKLSEVENVLYRLETDINGLNESINACNKQHTEIQESLATLAERIKSAQLEISTSFNGQQLEEVISTLQNSINLSKEEEQTAKEKFNDAKKIADDMKEHIRSLLELQQQIEAELHEDSSELDIKMSRFNNDNSPLQYFELEKIFSDGRDWYALREELEQKEKALDKANYDKERADLQMQEILQSEYRPYDNPNINETVLKGRQGVLQNNLQKLKESINSIQFLLDKHNDALEKLSACESERAQLEHNLSVWCKLNNIIGSADGSKFRNIAQHYTLSVITSYANAQLRTISSRYLLRVRPNSLDLEVIDHDMFDEVCDIHSLSNSNLFIICLSLSLGLASLQSGKFGAGTVFIDEGMGDLDEEDLNIVINALYRLQYSRGHKIGIISHSDQIKSRIYPQIIVDKTSISSSTITVK